MAELKKVMLAVKANLDKLQFPLLASPKLDGIRCVTPMGMAKSRTLKDIPNEHIRRMLKKLPYAYDLDGELVTLDADGNIEDFNTIQSHVMRKEGIAKFQFLVFDSIRNLEHGFEQRLQQAQNQCQSINAMQDEIVKLVPHVLIQNMNELHEFEAACIERGYEGVMTRAPGAWYKQGRSTVSQGWLTKIKRFADIEGIIIGAKQQRDQNGELKEGMLGAFEVHTKEFGTFEVGSGYTEAQRRQYWKDRDMLVHKDNWLMTIRYQPFGMKDKPRFPTFKGLRHIEDT